MCYSSIVVCDNYVISRMSQYKRVYNFFNGLVSFMLFYNLHLQCHPFVRDSMESCAHMYPSVTWHGIVFVVILCSVVDDYKHFGGTYCLHPQGGGMATTFKTTWLHSAEYHS